MFNQDHVQRTTRHISPKSAPTPDSSSLLAQTCAVSALYPPHRLDPDLRHATRGRISGPGRASAITSYASSPSPPAIIPSPAEAFVFKALIKRLLAPLFFRLHSRAHGKNMEVRFWRTWANKRGWHWQQQFQQRLDPNAEVTGHHRSILEAIHSPELRILDVGAGPISGIHPCFQGQALHIRACDPLGDDYRRILAENAITPRVVTETVPGENLSQHFRDERFDWINCDNALDHSESPHCVIDEMIAIAAPSATISLYHEIDEGLNEGYRGFHKWNIRPVAGRSDAFTIFNPQESHAYSGAYRGFAVTVEVQGRYVLCILRRTASSQ